MTPAVISWSGGKDSTLALQRVIAGGEFDVVGLLTTITAQYDRVSIHGVRASLLRAQSRSLGLPIIPVRIQANATNAEYETALWEELRLLRESGIEDVVFGDLFLKDVREYREEVLTDAGMRSHFPLWQMDTRQLANDFIAEGFRAVLVSVDPSQIEAHFCGREYDHSLLSELPATCDPCGEHGEFHTFVYDGKIFGEAVAFQRGETVNRSGFVYADLIG